MRSSLRFSAGSLVLWARRRISSARSRQCFGFERNGMADTSGRVKARRRPAVPGIVARLTCQRALLHSGTSVPFRAPTIMPRWQHDARIEAEAAVRHCRALIQHRQAEAQERERLGHDATEVRTLVRTFQLLLAEHEAYRDSLSADLRRSG